MPNAKLLEICNKEINSIEEQIQQYENSSFLDKSTMQYATLWQRLRDLQELREIYEEMKLTKSPEPAVKNLSKHMLKLL